MLKRYSKGHDWQELFRFFVFLFISGNVFSDSIAVFYALEADLKSLKSEALVTENSSAIGSRNINRMRLGSHEVFAVLMGSGCVETALSAQALLAKFNCDLAISVGPAGALNDSVITGRWYHVNPVSFWQKGTETSEGFRSHEKSTMWLKQNTNILHASIDSIWHETPLSLTSGEAFIASRAAKDRLHFATGADLVDMNSYGLAAACADHGVPLYILRVVSDGADEMAGETFRNFISTYDGEGGRLVARFIKNLPLNPDDPASYEKIKEMME